MHSNTRFYQVNFPKGFSLCWGGWITPLAPQTSGWCSGQEKVAAVMTKTPQHHSQHPKEQRNSPLQEFTKDGDQLNGETSNGRHCKGTCRMLSGPALPPGLAQRDGASAASQHTQQKGTEKAVGNKRNQLRETAELNLVHGIKWEHPIPSPYFAQDLLWCTWILTEPFNLFFKIPFNQTVLYFGCVVIQLY